MSDSGEEWMGGGSPSYSTSSSGEDEFVPAPASGSAKRKGKQPAQKKVEKDKGLTHDVVDEANNETSTKPATKKRKQANKTLATSLPLTMGSGKKAGSAFLLQSPSLDLRGDVAIIGRVHVDPEDENPMSLDIKGTVYQGKARPCSTFAVIEISGSGDASIAKITHLADSFIEVHAEKDTMVESVIEGDAGEDAMDEYVTADNVKGANSTSVSMKAAKSRKRKSQSNKKKA